LPSRVSIPFSLFSQLVIGCLAGAAAAPKLLSQVGFQSIRTDAFVPVGVGIGVLVGTGVAVGVGVFVGVGVLVGVGVGVLVGVKVGVAEGRGQ